MSGEKDLAVLLQDMEPVLNPGEYVFCTIEKLSRVPGLVKILFFFRETEAVTIVPKKNTAEEWNLDYTYISSWITLNIHSSLEAAGLTAAFANALKQANSSCNVIAAYFHDHIFVSEDDAEKALKTLRALKSAQRRYGKGKLSITLGFSFQNVWLPQLSSLPDIIAGTAGLSAEDSFLKFGFTGSAQSIAAGKASYARSQLYTTDRDLPLSDAASNSPFTAVLSSAQPDANALTELKSITSFFQNHEAFVAKALAFLEK